jgi:N-methylhydantoinase A/oxoprolinase/acetone carboxylase beta subunit
VSRVRIGVDVGVTNTDAVVMDTTGAVLAWMKSPTSPDHLVGIREAIAGALSRAGNVTATQVMAGSTHVADAISRRRNLAKVGVLRIGASSSLSIPPFTMWPNDLVERVAGPVALIRGGHEHDGREISPLDTDAVHAFAALCAGAVDGVAVVGMTSPVNADHERRAAAILRDLLGEHITITQGHVVGGIGLLERENSAILNSSLMGLHRTVIDGIGQVLIELGHTTDLYLTQNDGTLISASEAVRRPLLSIGSGPTNSMRGAAYLSGLTDAVVMDVGGTSTVLGLLVDGFPRVSGCPVEVGGVRTNYRMPELVSAQLGGATVVHRGSPPRIGPDNVGERLMTDGLVFGGAITTLSDVSVSAGRTALGDPALARVEPVLVRSVMAQVDARLVALADRTKASRAKLPLVAVGGAAHLVPDQMPGISAVLRYEHSPVANAIGAATAEASGSIDRIYSYDRSSRNRCITDAQQLASEDAVLAGADPARTRITKMTEIPMSYMPGNCVRVQVTALGPVTDSS